MEFEIYLWTTILISVAVLLSIALAIYQRCVSIGIMSGAVLIMYCTVLIPYKSEEVWVIYNGPKYCEGWNCGINGKPYFEQHTIFHYRLPGEDYQRCARFPNICHEKCKLKVSSVRSILNRHLYFSHELTCNSDDWWK